MGRFDSPLSVATLFLAATVVSVGLIFLFDAEEESRLAKEKSNKYPPLAQLTQHQNQQEKLEQNPPIQNPDYNNNKKSLADKDDRYVVAEPMEMEPESLSPDFISSTTPLASQSILGYFGHKIADLFKRHHSRSKRSTLTTEHDNDNANDDDNDDSSIEANDDSDFDSNEDAEEEDDDDEVGEPLALPLSSNSNPSPNSSPPSNSQGKSRRDTRADQILYDEHSKNYHNNDFNIWKPRHENNPVPVPLSAPVSPSPPSSPAFHKVRHAMKKLDSGGLDSDIVQRMILDTSPGRFRASNENQEQQQRNKQNPHPYPMINPNNNNNNNKHKNQNQNQDQFPYQQLNSDLRRNDNYYSFNTVSSSTPASTLSTTTLNTKPTPETPILSYYANTNANTNTNTNNNNDNNNNNNKNVPSSSSSSSSSEKRKSKNRNNKKKPSTSAPSFSAVMDMDNDSDKDKEKDKGKSRGGESRRKNIGGKGESGNNIDIDNDNDSDMNSDNESGRVVNDKDMENNEDEMERGGKTRKNHHINNSHGENSSWKSNEPGSGSGSDADSDKVKVKEPGEISSGSNSNYENGVKEYEDISTHPRQTHYHHHLDVDDGIGIDEHHSNSNGNGGNNERMPRNNNNNNNHHDNHHHHYSDNDNERDESDSKPHSDLGSDLDSDSDTLGSRPYITDTKKSILKEGVEMCYKTDDVLIVVAITCCLNFAFVLVVWGCTRWFSISTNNKEKDFHHLDCEDGADSILFHEEQDHEDCCWRSGSPTNLSKFQDIQDIQDGLDLHTLHCTSNHHHHHQQQQQHQRQSYQNQTILDSPSGKLRNVTSQHNSIHRPYKYHHPSNLAAASSPLSPLSPLSITSSTKVDSLFPSMSLGGGGGDTYEIFPLNPTRSSTSTTNATARRNSNSNSHTNSNSNSSIHSNNISSHFRAPPVASLRRPSDRFHFFRQKQYQKNLKEFGLGFGPSDEREDNDNYNYKYNYNDNDGRGGRHGYGHGHGHGQERHRIPFPLPWTNSHSHSHSNSNSSSNTKSGLPKSSASLYTFQVSDVPQKNYPQNSNSSSTTSRQKSYSHSMEDLRHTDFSGEHEGGRMKHEA